VESSRDTFRDGRFDRVGMRVVDCDIDIAGVLQRDSVVNSVVDGSHIVNLLSRAGDMTCQ